MSGKHWLSVLLIALLCAGAGVCADTADTLSREVQFTIPAQRLSDALIVFSDQSGIQIVTAGEDVSKLSTQGVSGKLSISVALGKLLDGTPLAYTAIGKSTVALVNPAARAADAGADAALRVAQAGQASTVPGGGEDERSSSEEESGPVTKGIPEILVTGTKERFSLNADIERTRDDARPYVVFDRAAVERSGAQNLEEFFRRNLTSLTGGKDLSQTRSVFGNLSLIDLGGLGTDETLLLIDGRRISGLMARGQVNQGDINGIPLSAVERIEVLRSTASGIYGGGATGGVINIILRRDYAGMEAKLTYGGTFDGGATARRVDVSGGYSLPNGATNIMLAGSYQEDAPLMVGDRNFIERARAQILKNDPDSLYGDPFSIPLGYTTNIVGLDPDTFGFANLTLKNNGGALNSPFAYVPVGYDGTNDAAFLGTAGEYNLALARTTQGAAAHSSLLQDGQRKSMMMTVRQTFTPRIAAFLEGAVSDKFSVTRSNPAFPFFFIPGDSPANPFNEFVMVAAPLPGPADSWKNQIDTTRVAAGLSSKLFGDWTAGVDYTWSRERLKSSKTAFFDSIGMDGVIYDGTVDVFRDTNRYPTDISALIYPGATPGYTVATTLRDLTARISGSVPLRLPGGSPVLSGSLERRHESNEDSILALEGISPTTFANRLYPALSQRVDSAYMEVLLPVVEALEVQAAARYDEYETRGAAPVALNGSGQPVTAVAYRTNRVHSFDPTASLRFKPAKDIMLRASYGTGFLPPSAVQLNSTAPSVLSPVTISQLQIRDPLRNNELISVGGPVTTIGGGNANLQPEQSESWSVGMVLTPRMLEGLRVSVDWTTIDKTDAVVSIPTGTQNLIPLLLQYAPERVIRAPATPGPGRITTIDLSSLNFASSSTEALDFAVEYLHSFPGIGEMKFSAAATDLLHSTSKIAPTAGEVENAGVLNNVFGNVKWRGNAGVQWSRNNWMASWAARYYGSYYLNVQHTAVPAQGGNTVASQIFHDLFVTYRTGSAGAGWRGWMSDATVQLGVINVFNKEPAYDYAALSGNYYSSLADPRLATYQLTVSKGFGQ